MTLTIRQIRAVQRDTRRDFKVVVPPRRRRSSISAFEVVLWSFALLAVGVFTWVALELGL
jgi:hypothetical protein